MTPPAHAADAAELRVGVLLDRWELPAWVHRALERIAELEGVALAGVLREAEPAPEPTGAFTSYERLDRRYLGGSPDPLALVDARELLGEAPVWNVQRSPTRPATLDEASLEQLRAAGLDVVVHVGGRGLDGEALLVPRLGVWTWSQLEAPRRASAPLLGAIRRPCAVCEVALVVLRPGEEPDRLLRRSWSTSDPNAREPTFPVSLHRARTLAYWKSAAFPARVLRALSARERELPSALPPAEPADSEPTPGWLGTAALGVVVASRMARRRVRRWRNDAIWSIAVRARSEGSALASMAGFRFLPMPADRFWADPFLATHEGRSYLFFEDGDIATQVGRIGCLELDGEGQIRESSTLLERETNLSYPFVFSWGGEWWMIPESSASRTVELHRATAFPWRWELDRVLFEDVRAADSTVWIEDGRLWLFTAMAEYGAADTDELHLFSSDDVRGPWKPHPMNPIVSDVRCARPAGRLFREDGALIRPGQDCSEAYGGSLRLQRVTVLNDDEYREEPERRVAADWCAGSVATHTLDRGAVFEVVDARLLRPRRWGREAR